MLGGAPLGTGPLVVVAGVSSESSLSGAGASVVRVRSGPSRQVRSVPDSLSYKQQSPRNYDLINLSLINRSSIKSKESKRNGTSCSNFRNEDQQRSRRRCHAPER